MSTFHSDIIYGPVYSRRLGRSLGINVFGNAGKRCPFDCVYCQLVDTRIVTPRRIRCEFNCASCADAITTRSSSSSSLPDVDSILRSLEFTLRKGDSLDYITFSGNGEPTVHPCFPEIVDGVKRLRDQLAPKVAVSILSNSATLAKPGVATAIASMDARVMKLDVGNLDAFNRLNRPCRSVSLESVISGLGTIGPFIMQTMLVHGPLGNSSREDIDSWMETASLLKPQEIQLYSTSRAPADTSVLPVPRTELEERADSIRRLTGLAVKVF